MKKIHTLLWGICMPFFLYCQQPNFIVILVDDLNDYIGVFGGNPQIETPNIDSLSQRGVSFMNAFCNAPGCAPSRTSILSGKDPNYTQVYTNDDYNDVFRDNFTEAQGNEEVYTIPQVLKDSGGYFTMAINKVFHSPHENDYDLEGELCSRGKSWNLSINITTDPYFDELADDYAFNNSFEFGMIPDSLEPMMQDYKAADTAAYFIHAYANNTINTCEKPFFLTLGFHKPHSSRNIPEKYFGDYYLNDVFIDSFPIIYNNPIGRYPYNGVLMPPQPVPMFNDFYQLPTAGLGQSMANAGSIFDAIEAFPESLPYLPEINPGLSDEERELILKETVSANNVAAYNAAVQFIDAMLGKVMDALYEYPDLAENTIIIFTSDHGFSLGEKRHWNKWALWETDIRVPMVVVYPGHAENVLSKRVVSLLDLFPTICDMAGVNYPMFEDGSNYLDGHSFISLMDEPNQLNSNVAVTTHKKNAGFGNCFPHYSVRNERFHYIRYQFNNDAGAGACDDLSSNYEEELYDIGSERQNDPYEWKNIAYEEDFIPVKEYLSEFVEGGVLYNEEPHILNVYNNDINCFLQQDDIIEMQALLFTPDAVLIEPVEMVNYTLEWTNNLTEEIFYGIQYTFDASTIPTETFEEAQQLIIYLRAIEIASGNVCAFRMKHLFLHPEYEPNIDFEPVITDHTLTISDVTLSGSHNNIVWDFGDGNISKSDHPGPYTYAAAGDYELKTTLYYGNKCYVTQSQILEIDSLVFKNNISPLQLQLYPNPATDHITLLCDAFDSEFTMQIFNTMGSLMMQDKVVFDAGILHVNVKKLPAGAYILKLTSSDITKNQIFEIVR